MCELISAVLTAAVVLTAGELLARWMEACK